MLPSDQLLELLSLFLAVAAFSLQSFHFLLILRYNSLSFVKVLLFDLIELIVHVVFHLEDLQIF